MQFFFWINKIKFIYWLESRLLFPVNCNNNLLPNRIPTYASIIPTETKLFNYYRPDIYPRAAEYRETLRSLRFLPETAPHPIPHTTCVIVCLWVSAATARRPKTTDVRARDRVVASRTQLRVDLVPTVSEPSRERTHVHQCWIGVSTRRPYDWAVPSISPVVISAKTE